MCWSADGGRARVRARVGERDVCQWCYDRYTAVRAWWSPRVLWISRVLSLPLKVYYVVAKDCAL